MTENMVSHGSFTIERDFDEPIERVFAAFIHHEARNQWLISPDNWDVRSFLPAVEVKQGSVEFSSFTMPGTGFVQSNYSVFLDIVPNALVVIATNCRLDDVTMSNSLLTAEFRPIKSGQTRLTLTEQGTYVGGQVTGREEYARKLLGLIPKGKRGG